MKQLLATIILFATIATNSMAQRFIHYEPVRVDSRTSTYGSNPFGNSTSTYSLPRQQQAENLQMVTAYYVNSRGAWEKLSVKVRVTENYNRVVVTVRAYYDKTYGRWQSTNSTASTVDVLDSNIVRENFDWKCHITGYGTVYF